MTAKDFNKDASMFTTKQKESVAEVFEKNAAWFSEHSVHHSKYMNKLFDYYNLHFDLEKFDEGDKNCDDCKTTVIKFWSYIIYDLWGRKIV